MYPLLLLVRLLVRLLVLALLLVLVLLALLALLALRCATVLTRRYRSQGKVRPVPAVVVSSTSGKAYDSRCSCW